MSAILILDEMPKDCSACGIGDSNGYCFYARDYADGVTDNWREGLRPDWCPLRMMPEKENTTNMAMLHQFAEDKHISGPQAVGYKLGWNALLDAITGEDD